MAKTGTPKTIFITITSVLLANKEGFLHMFCLNVVTEMGGGLCAKFKLKPGFCVAEERCVLQYRSFPSGFSVLCRWNPGDSSMSYWKRN